MSKESIEVDKQRYRESSGRCLEDFTVGDVYEHRPGRTINEADNTWFTLLTMNQHPVHVDHEYAKRTEFGRPLVNSCLTLSIVVGMSVSDVSQKAIANLGWTDIRMPSPVFHGDTLYAESKVTEVRDSATRPNDGVVTVVTRARNQRDELVMEFTRTILVPKRGHSVDDD
jgi:acyl dehydratase